MERIVRQPVWGVPVLSRLAGAQAARRSHSHSRRSAESGLVLSPLWLPPDHASGAAQRDRVGDWVVRRILQSDNLLAVRKRKFVLTTDAKHQFAVYPNLARYVRLSAINQLWVSDITYVRLGREFVYLAVVLDLSSRRVVGWSLGRSLHTSLALAALNSAITQRQPGPGLVHDSDRGTQYASDDYVQRLEQAHMWISMSRPARPWENAYCESFLRTLKNEEIYCRGYSALEELEQNIEDFMERFYNRERLHSWLGYCSPEEFEKTAAQPPSSLPAALSFARTSGNLSRCRGPVFTGERGGRSPVTHRNEFPAAYSLAGCSPAEPTSASSAVVFSTRNQPVRQHFPANGNCPLYPLSHFTAQSALGLFVFF